MKIAFLGDSITYGYALEDRSKKYSTLVCEKLGCEEENYGIAGTLMAKAGLNNEDGKDFCTRFHLIENADVAVIFGGTNDYFWSDKPIEGEGEQYFAGAVASICESVKKMRAGKITLFVTPYPHNGIGNYFGGEHWRGASSRHDTNEKNYNGHCLSDYVKVLCDTCDTYSLPCLNLHSDFNFDWRIHTSDGCHPNEKGHQLLAEHIAKKLRELIG